MSITVDDQFVELAAALRRVRRWRHLFAIGLGGLVLLTGALGMVVIITGYHGGESAAGMPLPVAVVLYAGGSVSFAWGCAHGSKRSFAWWLVITLLVGAVLSIVVAATGAFAGAGSGGGDGSSGSGTSEKPSTKLPRPEIAARIVDRGFVEQIVGRPADGPSSVGRVRRGKSIVAWHGPTHTSATSSLMTAQVLYRPGRGVEAPRVRHATTPRGSEVIVVKARSTDWQVALHVRSAASLDQVEPILVQRVNDALVALDSAQRR